MGPSRRCHDESDTPACMPTKQIEGDGFWSYVFSSCRWHSLVGVRRQCFPGLLSVIALRQTKTMRKDGSYSQEVF